MIDLHTHILPGMDDGAQTLAEALEMLQLAQQDGITHLVATPHIYRGPYQELNGEKIRKELSRLSSAAQQAGLEVNLFQGAEVHITHNLIEQIHRYRPDLVINQSDYIFIEFPADHVFPGVKDLFFELLSLGLTPIIAHPERNAVFVRQPRILYELVQMGALCQVNSGSFLGYYGEHVRQGVYNLLRFNLVHLMASDCHRPTTIPPLLSEAVELAAEVIGFDEAQALVNDNPRAVLENRTIPHYSPPRPPQERKKSFKLRRPVFHFFSRKH